MLQAGEGVKIAERMVPWGGTVCLRPDEAIGFDPVTVRATFTFDYSEINTGSEAFLDGE